MILHTTKEVFYCSNICSFKKRKISVYLEFCRGDKNAKDGF